MSSKEFFPTLIYTSRLLPRASVKFKKSILNECYKIRDYDTKGRRWSTKNYVGGYTSYASIAQLHNFSTQFSELKLKIDSHVRRFIQQLEMDLRGHKFFMTDCWLNIMPSHTTHSFHIHPLSFISGTYYVSTPSESACIRFEDPRLTHFMKAPPKRANCSVKNTPHIEIPARAGNLVLFESWLRHEVPASTNQNDRVSISFNYDWE